jgi:3-oxosteroid 1-dehydrogenase
VPEEVDVVVVGSGAGGLLAAARATSLGLHTVIVEKAHFYGGTSATSGGMFWIPDHGLDGHADSPEQAMTYLQSITAGNVSADRLRAYVDNGKRMLAYLKEIGIRCHALKALRCLAATRSMLRKQRH